MTLSNQTTLQGHCTVYINYAKYVVSTRLISVRLSVEGHESVQK